MQAPGVLAALLYPGALGGVVEVGQRGVVELQAGLLLHPDHAGDLLVLDRPQVRGRDPARGEVIAGLQQPVRAQQAAHVIGTERRAGPPGHR